MPVVLARVDQRLIHGITVNQWNGVLKPKRFMVVDDVISEDETVKASMRMSKPAGTGISVISREKAINNFRNGNYDDQKVFLIVKEPSILLDLINGGVEIPAINVGMIFNDDGRIPVTDRVALNSNELKDLKAIQSKGIPVTFQYTPNDTAIELDDATKDKNI
jgi:mannose/fructose/N-acetylgalactosamine-specific phosphotransferase system component IIB